MFIFELFFELLPFSYAACVRVAPFVILLSATTTFFLSLLLLLLLLLRSIEIGAPRNANKQTVNKTWKMWQTHIETKTWDLNVYELVSNGHRELPTMLVRSLSRHFDRIDCKTLQWLNNNKGLDLRSSKSTTRKSRCWAAIANARSLVSVWSSSLFRWFNDIDEFNYLSLSRLLCCPRSIQQALFCWFFKMWKHKIIYFVPYIEQQSPTNIHRQQFLLWLFKF